MSTLPSQADHDIAERANVAWGQAINGPHVAVLAAQMGREEGYRDGLMEGARALWKAATDCVTLSQTRTKVVEINAYAGAADLLNSWGNTLEIMANIPHPTLDGGSV